MMMMMYVCVCVCVCVFVCVVCKVGRGCAVRVGLDQKIQHGMAMALNGIK
jgi:hypothetical protein